MKVLRLGAALGKYPVDIIHQVNTLHGSPEKLLNLFIRCQLFPGVPVVWCEGAAAGSLCFDSGFMEPFLAIRCPVSSLSLTCPGTLGLVLVPVPGHDHGVQVRLLRSSLLGDKISVWIVHILHASCGIRPSLSD